MTYNPRNREPRSHEAALFNEIYIDETSQSGPRFLIVGGLVLPRHYSAQFEQAIIEARGSRLPLKFPDGNIREIKWRSCGRGDFEAYKKVVDTFFDFGSVMTSAQDNCKFHCSIVDTQVKGRHYSIGKKGQIGFNREIFFHLRLMAESYYPRKLFHVYPDYRSTNMTMTTLGFMLNRNLASRHDKRDYPFRRIQFRRSHDIQALQISDILLGALAYRINGHYDAENATPDKKLLADHVLGRAYAGPMMKRRVLKSKNWGNYTFHLRKHRMPKELRRP